MKSQHHRFIQDQLSGSGLKDTTQVYRRPIKTNNIRLISLNQPRTTRIPSFILLQPALPNKSRRKSFSDGPAGSKLTRLDCFYPSFDCAQHVLSAQRAKPKPDNKLILRKAVKRASMMMSTVKYWKGQSSQKIEMLPMKKSLHCQVERTELPLTSRSSKVEKQNVLLNLFKVKVNEQLVQYSKDKRAEKQKTKSVSHHTPMAIRSFTSRYSLQVMKHM